MTIQEDAVIAEKTRKFAALERGFLKCWYGSRRPSTKEELIDLFKESLHIAEQAFLVKQEITESFLGVSEVRISDPEVRSTLEKIRRDEPFYSISFYGDVVKLLKEMDATNKAAPSYDDDIGELIDTKWDKLFGDFHSWFSISNYYYAIMKIGPIISSFEVPSHLTGYFHEIRETFAFKQYRAATALCRALLEKSLYEKLKARRPFSNPNTGTVPSIAKTDFRNRNTGTVTPIFNRKKEEPGLVIYINMAERWGLLSEDLAKTARRINGVANDILHVREAPSLPTENDALDVVSGTLSILQRLYR